MGLRLSHVLMIRHARNISFLSLLSLFLCVIINVETTKKKLKKYRCIMVNNTLAKIEEKHFKT